MKVKFDEFVLSDLASEVDIAGKNVESFAKLSAARPIFFFLSPRAVDLSRQDIEYLLSLIEKRLAGSMLISNRMKCQSTRGVLVFLLGLSDECEKTLKVSYDGRVS